MEYRNSYISPLGRILLTADEIGLTGLAFEGQKNAVQGLIRESEEKETTLFSGDEKMAGYIFFRSGTGLSNTDSFGRNRFSDVCVGDALHDPVWRDNDIRRNRKADRT